MDESTRPHLLLVEDESVLQRTLLRSLEAREFRVRAVNTAADAVALAQSGTFDLMLLDVNLPDASGWDVLRALRRSRDSPPVVVLSAANPNPDRVREFRPRGVLLKPFPIEALLNLIGAALDDGAEAGVRDRAALWEGK